MASPSTKSFARELIRNTARQRAAGNPSERCVVTACCGQLQRYVRDFRVLDYQLSTVQGDETNEDTTITNRITQVHGSGNELKFRMELFASDADEQADYQENADVDLIGVMIYDFTKIPLNRFESKRRHGKRIYNLDFEVEVLMGTKEGVLRFRVKTKDDLIGEMEIDFSIG